MGRRARKKEDRARAEADARAKSLANAEAAEAKRQKDESDRLLAEQKQIRKEYADRGRTMRGGGRTGLMYKQNQRGV